MNRFNNPVHVGLRDRMSRDLVAVYPHTVRGSNEEVYQEVESWFNQRGYSLHDEPRQYFVDTITEDEFKAMKK